MEKFRSIDLDEEQKFELMDSRPGWSSLSGYMEYKPADGIQRLMFRRRLWFILDDFKRALLGYRSQDQARLPAQNPTVVIDLQSAGIYLNSREKCQFTVISHSSEHQFTADNHESAMIWLLSLQSLRNRCSQVTPSQPLASATAAMAASFTGTSVASELEDGTPICRTSRKSTRTSSSSVQMMLTTRTVSPPSSLHLPCGFSSSASSSSCSSSQQPPPPPRLSTTTIRRFSATSQRYWYEKYQHQKRLTRVFRDRGISLDSGLEFYRRQGVPFHELCFGWEPGDDVFDNDNSSLSSEPHATTTTTSAKMKKAHSDDTNLGGKELTPFHMIFTQNNTNSSASSSSRSGRIESVDSALDHNHTDLIHQLVDLENQLLTSKCEMAKLLNKETYFKDLLDKRDLMIKGLDQKIKEMEEDQKSKTSIADRVQNQIRELQDQTQFLSREIRHLSHLRHLDYQHIQHQKRNAGDLRACIEAWKDHYVYLLQSCITVPSGDTADQWHLNLFGGDTHRYRVQELLAEARLSNPSLPEYSWLHSRMSHVDQYGFRHVFDNENLLLHHLCQQLHLHYRTLHPDHEPCIRRWTQIVTSPVGTTISATKEMKQLCRRGIPVQFRGDAWKRLVYSQVADVVDEAGSHYYAHLVTRAHDSQLASCYRKQIYVDLMRTMPTNINFSTEPAEGIRRMKEVLQAFSIHNPSVGYCQGLNFVAAVCLLFLDTEDAFWALVAITEKFFSPLYFDKGLTGAKVDQEVFKELISQKLPKLHQHLQNFDIELPTVTLNWFLAIFFDVVPFQTLLRIWDCFLLEGPKVLFRFSLAILKSNEDRLLEQQDTISLLRYLKVCTRLLFDAEGLVKTAFEDMKPFPRKQEIAQKQSMHLENLTERLKRKALRMPSKVDRLQQECLDQELKLSPSALHYDCITVCSEGVVWLFLGCQTRARVSVLDWRDGLLRTVPDAEFESRILCAFAVEELILIATLSKQLYAFSSRKFRKLWCICLNDVALSISSRKQRNDDWMVFVGLGDGTLAVIEYVQSGRTANEEPLYVQIGRSALTAVHLVNDNRLWVACGNVVHILNAITLDVLTRVQVSTNSQDYVYTLAVGDEGVWMSLNGSSVVELWDKSEFICRMLYDITKGHWISHKKEEESVNQRRITAILPVGSTLWIGRGDGTLQIFDVSSTLSKPHSLPASSGGSSKEIQQLRKNSVVRSSLHLDTCSEDAVLNGGRGVDESAVAAKERSNLGLRRIGRKYEDGVGVTLKTDLDPTAPQVKDRKRTSRRLCHIRSSEHKRSSSEPFHRMSLTSAGSTGQEVDPVDDGSAMDERQATKVVDRRLSSVKVKTMGSRKGSLHDLAYPVTLNLQTMVKISEKPVRCLAQLKVSEQKIPTVVSCSGYHGDDEAVLLWTKQQGEEVWSNSPVYELTQDPTQKRRFSQFDRQKPNLRVRSEARRKTEIF